MCVWGMLGVCGMGCCSDVLFLWLEFLTVGRPQRRTQPYTSCEKESEKGAKILEHCSTEQAYV